MFTDTSVDFFFLPCARLSATHDVLDVHRNSWNICTIRTRRKLQIPRIYERARSQFIIRFKRRLPNSGKLISVKFQEMRQWLKRSNEGRVARAHTSGEAQMSDFISLLSIFQLSPHSSFLNPFSTPAQILPKVCMNCTAQQTEQTTDRRSLLWVWPLHKWAPFDKTGRYPSPSW